MRNGYQIGEKLGSICMEREEDEEEKKQSPTALFKGRYAAAGAAVLEVELKGAIIIQGEQLTRSNDGVPLRV